MANPPYHEHESGARLWFTHVNQMVLFHEIRYISMGNPGHATGLPGGGI